MEKENELWMGTDIFILALQMSLCAAHSGDLLDGRGDPVGCDLVSTNVPVSHVGLVTGSANCTALLQSKHYVTITLST